MLQLVNMFGFVLDRPLIQHHLKLVLIDLDQTKLLFYRQRKEAETFSRVSLTAAARLSWIQQLRLRAQGAMEGYCACKADTQTHTHTAHSGSSSSFLCLV